MYDVSGDLDLGNVWHETWRVCEAALVIDCKSPSICSMRMGKKGSRGSRAVGEPRAA
jgi:hypothetical protein